jgi:hypothetical protein
MSKAKELRDKFEKDLKELQDNCPHTDSEWMPFMWAPGHFGPKVRVCGECDKILEQEKWEPFTLKDLKGNIVTKIEIPYEVEECAREVILFYFQHWDQGVEKRIEALNNAIALAGIKAKFVQNGKESGWKCASELDGLRAKDFRKKLEECWPLGQFEQEAEAVANLIIKTKNEGGEEDEERE